MTINNIDLTCVEIEPSLPATHTMIWLHGLGADGHDFVPFVSELDSDTITDMRFIFPHAPLIPITINNGYTMRGWYDIYALSLDAKTDIQGIRQSQAQIEQLITKEINRGINPENIFLGGFSQGAAIALATGLSRQTALAGVIALSGYLPLDPSLRDDILSTKQTTPVFQAHGMLDPIVPYILGKASYEWLKQVGKNINWHSYQVEHTVSKEEINDINAWIKSRKNQN